MQSTSFSPSMLPCNPALPRSTKRTRRATAKRSEARVLALRREEDGRRLGDGYSGGHHVDRDMIVLRKRIHEMRAAEQSLEPPPEWTDWEKRCYASYDSIICETMGFLQSRMMDSRPAVVLGAAALVVFSVPTASALALLRLAEMAREILAAFHLCA